MLTFILMQMLSLIIEGQSALATARLLTAIDEDDSTLSTLVVDSTTGFLTADFVTLGSEDFCYSNVTATTFTVTERGCNETKLAGHSIGTRVYNPSTGMINQMIGFNIIQVLADDGFFKAGFRAFTALPQLAKSIGNMVIWNYSFLEGGLVWFKYALYALSAAMILDFINLVLRRGGG